MSSPTWRRVTKADPCPICGKPDLCGIAPDGSPAICMRIEAGSARQTRNGRYLHYLAGVERKSSGLRAVTLPERTASRNDLPILAKQHRTAVNPARLLRLAERLGVTVTSLNRLDIGWAFDAGAWAFPMTDATGRLLGIHLRLDSGRKFAVTGGREGLFIPADLPQGGELLIAEGPTDCAALLDLGFAAAGGTPAACRAQAGHARHAGRVIR